MPKYRHPELEGSESQTLYTFELKSRRKTRLVRLCWVLLGLVIGMGGTAATYIALTTQWTDVISSIDIPLQTNRDSGQKYQEGLSKAMSAAELTQSAEFKEDWVRVAMLWQEAITHMDNVPANNNEGAVAQQKVGEYQRNLQYAQSNVQTRPSRNPNVQEFWIPGTDRSVVIDIQGTPSRVIRYDTFCQEILYYGDSRVELQHGQVSEYDNVGNNLKVVGDATTASIFQGDRSFWTLGSLKEEVFRFQGAPDRIINYETIGKEMLYYGNSSIELEDGSVVGYRNEDRNLKVAIPTPSIDSSENVSPSWSLGASRAEVLNTQQQTPTQVTRNNAACKETLAFGDSSVELKHGIVTGYDNISRNLRVR